MLSFMRFTACPFCHLGIHQLISNGQAFDENFIVIAVFDSSLGNLQKQSKDQKAPFAILADEQGIIEPIYKGKDSADHLSFERVKAFASFKK